MSIAEELRADIDGASNDFEAWCADVREVYVFSSLTPDCGWVPHFEHDKASAENLRWTCAEAGEQVTAIRCLTVRR